MMRATSIRQILGKVDKLLLILKWLLRAIKWKARTPNFHGGSAIAIALAKLESELTVVQ